MMEKVKVLVVGSGIIGLQTAAKLRSRLGCSVLLYSSDHPLKTTSVGAGGLWMPFHCEPAKLVNAWSEETLRHYIELANDGNDMVEILQAYQVGFEEMLERPGWADHLQGVLNFEVEKVKNLNLPPSLSPYTHAWSFKTPIVDPPRYLEFLLKQLQTDKNVDVRLDEARFRSAEDVELYAKKNNCSVVVNCSGMGSRVIFNDEKLTPARGALLHFERPKNCNTILMIDSGPIGSPNRPSYLIPRGNILVAGGTYLEGDETPNVTEAEIKTIDGNARKLFPSLTQKHKGTWVGFRPVRDGGIRIEQDSLPGGIKLFHNYGHGGSGWTVFVGAANATVDMVAEYLKQAKL